MVLNVTERLKKTGKRSDQWIYSRKTIFDLDKKNFSRIVRTESGYKKLKNEWEMGKQRQKRLEIFY